MLSALMKPTLNKESSLPLQLFLLPLVVLQIQRAGMHVCGILPRVYIHTLWLHSEEIIQTKEKPILTLLLFGLKENALKECAGG